MGQPVLIDSHCHLDFTVFDEDRDTLLQRARKSGVHAFVVPGVTAARFTHVLDLAKRTPDLFPALGLHPCFMPEHHAEHLQLLEQCLEAGKVYAVGEIGLDLFIPAADFNAQHQLFEAQVQLAKQFQLPVILHVRKAHDQVLALLRKVHFKQGGIVHAFSGSLQQAKQYMDMGFLLGVGGTVTYPRATKVRQWVAELPLNAFALETDAPDMPMFGRQGQVNSPEYLPQVLERVAELRGEGIDVIATQTTANVSRLLKLPTLGVYS